MVAQVDERVVRHRNDALARVAIDGAERVELLEEHLAEARLFLELAPRSVFEQLLDADEAARQRPLAFERGQGPLYQQDLEIVGIDAEDDAVDGEGGARVFIAGHAVLLSVRITPSVSLVH